MLIAVLVFAARGHGAPIDPERARRALLNDFRAAFSSPVSFAYEVEVESRGRDGWFTRYRTIWKRRGPLVGGDIYCLRLAADAGQDRSRARLLIVSGGAGYDAMDKPVGFLAFRKESGRIHFDSAGPIMAYLFPVWQKTMAQSLADLPLVAADLEGDSLTVLLPFTAESERARTQGIPVWGALGWRCRFRRDDEKRWRMVLLEHIQTYELLVDGKRVRNPAILPASGPVQWQETRGGITERHAFEAFLHVGEDVVPTNLESETSAISWSSRVVPGSIVLDAPLTDSDFEHRPPLEFGDRGVIADMETREVLHVGQPEGGPDGSIRTMTRHGDELRRASTSRPAAPWIVAGAVAVLLFAIGAAWRAVRRGRAS